MSKEPKLIDADTEAEIDGCAAEMIGALCEGFPEARTIDVLNAFLREFTKLAVEESS